MTRSVGLELGNDVCYCREPLYLEGTKAWLYSDRGSIYSSKVQLAADCVKLLDVINGFGRRTIRCAAAAIISDGVTVFIGW